jgi:hypothetical protein
VEHLPGCINRLNLSSGGGFGAFGGLQLPRTKKAIRSMEGSMAYPRNFPNLPKLEEAGPEDRSSLMPTEAASWSVLGTEQQFSASFEHEGGATLTGCAFSSC